MQEKKKQLLWFLTNRQLKNVIIILGLGVILHLVSVKTKLHFLGLQRCVQNGELAVWKMYLVYLVLIEIFKALTDLYTTFFFETIQRYMQFNLFARYQRFFRLHEKGVNIAYKIIYNIVNLPIILMSGGFAIYFVVKTIEMIDYNLLHILIALLIMLIAIITGILRGRVIGVKEAENAKIGQKKGDLTKYEVSSRTFLNCALYVLDLEYISRTKMALKKGSLEKLPELVKQILYIALVWGLVDTLASDEVYSQSYLILTAFTSVITIAAEISRIFEIVFSILQMKTNENLKTLNDFEKKENTLLEINKPFINLTKEGLYISPLISLDLQGANGKKKYYKPQGEIIVKQTENAWLYGEKEAGKSRLLTFIKDSFPDYVMIYNDNGKIFNLFRENLKCDYALDYDLVRRLAKGLKLERIANLDDNEMLTLDISNVNTGDKHLCVALVMFYFAIKEPENARLIILDELLANVDEKNSIEILEFINELKKEIGCSYIFVGHSQGELIKKYCTSKIKLVANDITVIVDQQKI